MKRMRSVGKGPFRTFLAGLLVLLGLVLLPAAAYQLTYAGRILWLERTLQGDRSHAHGLEIAIKANWNDQIFWEISYKPEEETGRLTAVRTMTTAEWNAFYGGGDWKARWEACETDQRDLLPEGFTVPKELRCLVSRQDGRVAVAGIPGGSSNEPMAFRLWILEDGEVTYEGEFICSLNYSVFGQQIPDEERSLWGRYFSPVASKNNFRLFLACSEDGSFQMSWH